MNSLSPSLLSADFAHLEQELQAIEQGGAAYVHIDVMDGMFVPNITFGIPVIKSLRKWTSLKFDVHLMIEEPERFIQDFAACGADIITVHAESTKHLNRVLNQIRECGCCVGIALNPATPLSVLDHVLEYVDKPNHRCHAAGDSNTAGFYLDLGGDQPKDRGAGGRNGRSADL